MEVLCREHLEVYISIYIHHLFYKDWNILLAKLTISELGLSAEEIERCFKEGMMWNVEIIEEKKKVKTDRIAF